MVRNNIIWNCIMIIRPLVLGLPHLWIIQEPICTTHYNPNLEADLNFELSVHFLNDYSLPLRYLSSRSNSSGFSPTVSSSLLRSSFFNCRTVSFDNPLDNSSSSMSDHTALKEYLRVIKVDLNLHFFLQMVELRTMKWCWSPYLIDIHDLLGQL